MDFPVDDLSELRASIGDATADFNRSRRSAKEFAAAIRGHATDIEEIAPYTAGALERLAAALERSGLR